jgi:hypothetical protein
MFDYTAVSDSKLRMGGASTLRHLLVMTGSRSHVSTYPQLYFVRFMDSEMAGVPEEEDGHVRWGGKPLKRRQNNEPHVCMSRDITPKI